MNNLDIRLATISDILDILPLMSQLGYLASPEELIMRFKNFINSKRIWHCRS